MKLTDFALIFVVVFLPIVVIAYVNTTLVVKAEKNEMYYKNVINSATRDAVTAMKQVENPDVDYGYSGIINKKISINANVAVDTFYSSLANNFGIANNDKALDRLKMYIPVIAVIDYDGIYIHSLEPTNNGNSYKFITKPKIRYKYSYVIQRISKYNSDDTFKIIDISKNSIPGNLLSNYIYEINFTMDDYVYLNVYAINGGLVLSKRFYLADINNNQDLIYAPYNLTSSAEKKLKSEIIKHLSEKRTDIISEIGMKHIAYAVNKHNEFASSSGIKYEFKFSVESDEEWYETMSGLGLITIVQGISLGNRNLNFVSYSASDLTAVKRYYVSIPVETDLNDESRYYLKNKLYHLSTECDIYKYYLDNIKDVVLPTYYLSKADAATQGYYSCPICKP